MTNAGVIVMRMGLPSRRREMLITEAVYKALGVPMGLKLEEHETYEGGGFALLDGRAATAGLCSRTTKGVLEAARNFLLESGLADIFIILNL